MTQKNLLRLFALLLFAAFPHQQSFSQCFQIESILVDACGAQEGLNEMVRFKAGNTPFNANTMIVDWPNNTWEGIVQNATTASKTAALNADITAAGGCAQLIEPPGGIIPANATAILVTSYDFDTALNPFGAITEPIYIIYQNATTTAGHFANFGSGLRTLSIVAGACADTVTYDRSLLEDETGAHVAANGATVLFDPANNPDYINNGCLAPVPPFSVDAGNPVSGCAGATVSLSGSAEGEQSVLWSAASGSFSNATNVSTTYTIPANATGTITLTLTATNICGATVTDTVIITVTNTIVPNFATTLTLCSGSVQPALATTSPNGVTGNWSPSTINNTTSGSYVFTPNPNQCASSVTLTVTVTNNITPNFATALTLCSGSVPPALATTSPNGITGSWNPATINNTTSGNYVFTPNPNQCASSVTLTVTVSNSITPNFPTTLTVCNGATPPTLDTTSQNGISGSWNPPTINNTTGGTYVFTPNPNQCASSVTLTVTVAPSVAPDFPTTMTICNGATPPVLSTTAPNGVTGTWNPSAIDNTTSGTYVFTPNMNSCVSNLTLTVTVTNNIVPNFPTALTLCSGNVPPVLATTSPNGITGSWNPAIINNITGGNYVFTPNLNQCASSVTLIVTVTNSIVPDFTTSLTICNGTTPPVLATTSPNGVTGNWNPATISNTASGNYIFTPNAGQCSSPVTLTVIVTSGIVPDFETSLTLCSGNVPPVLATTSPNGITGSWNPSTINNTISGNYIFSPDAGQCAVPMTLSVTISSFAFEIEQYCSGSAYVATAVPVAGSFDPNTADFVWTDSNGNVIGNATLFDVSDWSDTHPQATFPQTFTLTVTNENGCTATQNVTVIEIFCSIPKGISPNNDGLNDSFDLSTMGIRTLSIFNRYGTKVYSAANYTNQWHGQTDNGNSLPDGTYYYVIESASRNSWTGWVYISSELN